MGAMWALDGDDMIESVELAADGEIAGINDGLVGEGDNAAESVDCVTEALRFRRLFVDDKRPNTFSFFFHLSRFPS
jgi:hypothetical protein